TRLQNTEPGLVRGKAAYMAPEQLLRERVSRSADVFAAAVVLWEALANRRFVDEHDADALARRVRGGGAEEAPPSRHRPGIGGALDRVVVRGLAQKPRDRFPTAEAMAVALRDACAPAGAAEIARWLERVAADDLELSDERVRLLEQGAIEVTPSSSPAV